MSRRSAVDRDFRRRSNRKKSCKAIVDGQ